MGDGIEQVRVFWPSGDLPASLSEEEIARVQEAIGRAAARWAERHGVLEAAQPEQVASFYAALKDERDRQVSEMAREAKR